VVKHFTTIFRNTKNLIIKILHATKLQTNKFIACFPLDDFFAVLLLFPNLDCIIQNIKQYGVVELGESGTPRA